MKEKKAEDEIGHRLRFESFKPWLSTSKGDEEKTGHAD